MTNAAPSAMHAFTTRSARLFRFVRVRLSRKLWGSYRVRLGNPCSAVLCAMLAGIGLPAFAGPTDGVVTAGQATISTPSAQLTLINQSSAKAVINWQSFNIGASETVRFVQPSATSVALNRVVGADPSKIFGTLTANGQVFLVNQQGVYFAPSARVDVGGLVATSLAMSDADFKAGRYRFGAGGAGAVTNAGSITAAAGGFVVLAADQVRNEGSIAADGGSVGLLAGSRVALDLAGDRLVSFSVDGAALRATVVNAGQIRADGGAVTLHANALGGVLATVVNQSGFIRANTVSSQGGMVTLRAQGGDTVVTGRIEADGRGTGQQGGG